MKAIWKTRLLLAPNQPWLPKLSCFGFLWLSLRSNLQGEAVSAFLGVCVVSLDSAVAEWRKLGSKWGQMFLLDPSNAVLFPSKAGIQANKWNFHSAQHRFESHTKPLGRTCLFLHACIRTCLQLVRMRKDSAGQKAKAWVENLDEEKALAAMMADAADSPLQLTRKMDSEEVDPATMSNDIALCLQEIQALFVHGEVLHRFGYTTTD